MDENQVFFLFFFFIWPKLSATKSRDSACSLVLASAFSRVDQYTDLYEVWPSSTEITRKLQGVYTKLMVVKNTQLRKPVKFSEADPHPGFLTIEDKNLLIKKARTLQWISRISLFLFALDVVQERQT